MLQLLLEEIAFWPSLLCLVTALRLKDYLLMARFSVKLFMSKYPKGLREVEAFIWFGHVCISPDYKVEQSLQARIDCRCASPLFLVYS